MSIKACYSIIFVVCLVFSIKVRAQNPAPTPTTVDENSVVKISTNLIQIDVIVTDRDGKQVTNLKAEDFEVFENDKIQKITNFSYISPGNSGQPDRLQSDEQRLSDSTNKILIPPAKINPAQVRRTFAIVIDDLNISFENISAMKDALRKFINEQVMEGDLAAIIRTGKNAGALQSFTSDKRQLLSSIEKIQWNPQGRGGISSIEPIGITLKEQIEGIKETSATGRAKVIEGNESDLEFENYNNQSRHEGFSLATLSVLNYIVSGMKQLPGRKSILLFSEGFSINAKNSGENQSPQSSPVFTELKTLADLANRSSVVFYTFDPRNLQDYSGLRAEDNIQGVFVGKFDVNNDKIGDKKRNREDAIIDSQYSLLYLANETGGMVFVNKNKLDDGLKKAINYLQGYYLIGYVPDEETFSQEKNRFNKLTVKLKRDDLTVRYRSGFYKVRENVKNEPETKLTAQQKIYQALTSPFGFSEISLNMDAIFSVDEQQGSVVRSIVQIDGRDLSFSQRSDGFFSANFDIVAVVFGDNGNIVSKISKNYPIRVTEKDYQKIIKEGVYYSLSVPVKKPGAYQFRLALHDKSSDKVSSATQFVEIPPVESGKLTLSGIMLSNFSTVQWQKITAGQISKTSADDEINVFNRSRRNYKRGTVLRYDFSIYNARANQGQIQVQIKLLLNGKVVLGDKPSPLDLNGQTDLKRIQSSGAILLGEDLAPGNYALQITVTDNSAKEKKRTAVGWADFELMP